MERKNKYSSAFKKHSDEIIRIPTQNLLYLNDAIKNNSYSLQTVFTKFYFNV